MWNWDSGGAPIHVTLSSSSSASEETVALVSHNDYTKDSSSKDLKKSKQPLDTTSLPSIYNLLHHCTVFGLILLYSYICENHPPYPHDEKTYDRDEFFFWTILVVVIAGGHSLKKNVDIRNNATRQTSRSVIKQGMQDNRNRDDNSPDNAILNRHQTEEWK
eukprot:scaffold26783_cov93-Skeletonema_dohrnii-CCMP3373.AAC.1